MFTPYEYTWISPGKGALQLGAFVALVVSVCLGIKMVYPDQPAYPREFEGGLDRELGGKGAVRVGFVGPQWPRSFFPVLKSSSLTFCTRQEWRVILIHESIEVGMEGDVYT